MTKIRNALTLPLAQSVAGMMTDGQWAMDDGLFANVMSENERQEAIEFRISKGMISLLAVTTPAGAIRAMFPEDFDDAELMGDPDEYSDDDLPDPVTMDWECPYWADPEVDDDLLIAARLHREHRLSLGLED